MTAREILIELFNEEAAYDNPVDAADLMLSRLEARGFVVVPMEATKEIKEALREAIYKSTVGPARIWRVAVNAALGVMVEL